MMTTKSPGGSTFPYYYKGGEVHCLKYGSYFGNHTKLFEVMQAEEAFIKQTKKRIKNHILKLAIIGLSFRAKWKLTRRIRKQGKAEVFGIRYFVDPEDAKTWLVGESMIK